MVGALSRPRLSPLMRAIRATEGLGLTVVGCYDALYRATTSSWEDVRGASGGPTITLTGSPTLSNGVYTFNGTDQYGRCENGRLSEMTAACAVVLIGTAPATGGTAEVVAELSIGAATTAIQFLRRASNGTLGDGSSANSVAVGAGVRCLHARRAAASGGNVTFGIRDGSGTEGTAAVATVDRTITRLTLGASKADTPASYADLTGLRTVVLIKGDHAAASQAIWNQYAVLRGATV